MTQPNVPEPSVWADIAEELRKIAADCRDLIGQPAPRLFQINLQPHCGPTHPPTPKERAETVTAVDTVAQILLGRSAKTEPVGGDTFHHGARGSRGPVSFSIYQQVADPTLVDPDDELARLRAENEALRAELTKPLMCGGECLRVAGHIGEHTFADPTGLTYGRGDESEGEGAPQVDRRVAPHFESGRELPDDALPDANERAIQRGLGDS